MPTVWFILVGFMIAAYVVLDGFDIGVGILHIVLGHTDIERRMLLRAIGPLWDGNEVWIIAGGGTLFLAFPLLYASSFSGFYMPLMVLLWLLVGRGVSVAFRTHINSSVWTNFFDVAFSLSSAGLAAFYGAAFANVLRGVPLNSQHFFFEPLWTNFMPGAHPGILDWFTVIAAGVALVALSMHGAIFVALKTSGTMQVRARNAAMLLWGAVVFLAASEILATVLIRPMLKTNYLTHPGWFAVPSGVGVTLLLVLYFLAAGKDRAALYTSAAFLVLMIAGAAIALYPAVLPSSGNPQYSLTIYNAQASPASLRLALYWWLPGMAVAIAYFVFIYRMFRGKSAVYLP